MTWHHFNRDDGIMTLEVHLQPGAKTYGIEKREDGTLKVRITARPIEGQANEALCKYMAARLKVAKSSVRVQRGATSRRKTLAIQIADFDPGWILDDK